MSADDEAPTPEELQEAEALARALDGEAGAVPPADVMPVVGLLRQARAGSALGEGRARALGARLRGQLAPAPRRRWLWWALPPIAAAATAAVLLAPWRRPPVGLPRPSAALLAAQAAAARGDRQALATLDREMRGYREALFRQVERQQ